jgi:hypothetical protein
VKPGQSAASLATLALLVFLAGERHLTAQGVFPSRDVRIEIAVGADRCASVRERYLLTRPWHGFDAGNGGGEAMFEFLSIPCSAVGPVTASIAGHTTALGADTRTRAPWVALIVPPTFIAASGRGDWRLEYDVRLEGRNAWVPIAMPSATLERSEGSRGAAVDIDVTFPGQPDARILLPQLRQSGNRWQGRFLAIPSSVRAALPANGAAACDAATAGTTGGLEWRFALFAGTMAAWVPLYLWWFGRRRWPEAS